MNKDRVDRLLKFALAKAAEEDPGNRELGVIHLLKLLYLADLAFAERHAGKSFTGIPWIFYSFGPWDLGAHQEIEAFLGAMALVPRRFQAPRFEVKRYAIPADHWLQGEAEDLGRAIPTEIYLAMKRHIHDFGSDTETLLRFIYSTLPMLYAKPGQPIDLEHAVPTVCSRDEPSRSDMVVSISKTKAKRREERRLEMKREIQAKIQERIQQRLENRVSPPLEAGFLAIQAQLNEEEMYDPIQLAGRLGFEPSIWEGDFRRECGLS